MDSDELGLRSQAGISTGVPGLWLIDVTDSGISSIDGGENDAFSCARGVDSIGGGSGGEARCGQRRGPRTHRAHSCSCAQGPRTARRVPVPVRFPRRSRPQPPEEPRHVLAAMGAAVARLAVLGSGHPRLGAPQVSRGFSRDPRGRVGPGCGTRGWRQGCGRAPPGPRRCRRRSPGTTRGSGGRLGPPRRAAALPPAPAPRSAVPETRSLRSGFRAGAAASARTRGLGGQGTSGRALNAFGGGTASGPPAPAPSGPRLRTEFADPPSAETPPYSRDSAPRLDLYP